ncbi:MAG: sigma 54-interacting transcriptional regulator [Planctomycetes bacterium]|nr:sigma 54-interacting transcriptional regulator [Planctomycetota bacterium]
MQRFRPILLAVWQEVCRHIELREAAVTLAGLLQKQMPLKQLILRRIDREHGALVTVGVAPTLEGAAAVDARRPLSPADLRRLQTWCRADKAARGGSKPDRILELLLPGDTDGDVIAAPLTNNGEPIGVVIVVCGPRQHFGGDHVLMVEALRDPLAAALENDRRIHEMAALREAAEADRGTLLRRLGRSELADEIVGQGTGLLNVMQRVDLVARSDVPVLILGETGTGKELIARAIHNRGPRHAGPFLRVNCGAIPRELIDSQLFGHERGSFTGADDARPGWFERADGGTLFLDEIGELPLEAQVRFLRVLQDGFVERVGGRQALSVDVRIVAATHRDLAGMVRASSFREDLWYRLAVFPILLPPLRERRDDIAAIAQHFAQRAAVRFGLPPALPTDDDVRILSSYDWPGNVRELGAVIDRAAILGDGRSLEVAKALGLGQWTGSIPPAAAAAAPRVPTTVASGAFATLEEAMRQHIEAALRLSGGRIEGRHGAASLLKINPHTLRARMRKLGIRWQQFREED